MGTDNITVSKPAETLSKMQIACLVIYCVILMVGTVGNGLVIYVTGFRMKRTVNSVWFLNLSLADFLFTAFLIFSTIALSQGHRWQFGLIMCKLNTFVTAVNMFASVFLLMAISLDRCLSTCVVVWAQNKRTVCKAQLISVAIWLTAMVCSTPYATFRKLSEKDNSTYCVHSGDITQKWILATFRFIIAFLIPFLVIMASYVAIGVRARRMQRTRKRRSRRIIIVVILAFFLCWLPFHVFQFLELKFHVNPKLYKSIIMTGGPLTVCLAFLNSCLNPILYVFMCDEFQKKFKQSICHVFESALAEDHFSFMSSRSLSSQLSRISRKSDSAVPMEKKDNVTSLIFKECRVDATDEKDTLSTD